MQHKLLNLSAVQVKFDGDQAHKFTGYASVFNGLDSYGDMIMPGAYKNTLQDRERPIRMRWNHYGPVIGKYLDLHEDEHGLYVEGELTPGHSVAENVAASLKHGAIDGLSIGYRVRDFEQRGDARILKDIELIEISVVEEPADSAALISGFKSHINECDSIKEIEGLLRDAAGFSRADAVALVCRVKHLLRDAAKPDDISTLRAHIEGISNRIITR